MVGILEERLAKALVTSRFSFEDVRELLARLSDRKFSQVQFLEMFEHFAREREHRMARAKAASSDLVDGVTHLLVLDAKFSPSEAGYLLWQAIQDGGAAVPPFRQRSKLDSWLRSVSRHVPPSELMYLATRIANSKKPGGSNLPWKLPEFPDQDSREHSRRPS